MAISTISSPYALTISGSVLQTVYASTTTITSTTSSSYVASNVSATITPKFATSKILAIVSGVTYGNAIGAQCSLKLYRNGSDLGYIMAQVYGNSSTVEGQGNFSVVDSPATTSATTYTVYVGSTNANLNVLFPQTGFGNIVLMEIAA